MTNQPKAQSVASPLRGHTLRRAGSYRGRKGFTLIEMLTAVGIIFVLVAISIIGFRHLNRSSKDSATKAALQSLRAWCTELEAATASANGLRGYELLALPGISIGSTQIRSYRTPTAILKWPLPVSQPALDATLDAVFACGDVAEVAVNPANAGRYGYAVQATSLVMGRLMTLPSVKAAVERLPADKLLRGPTGSVFFTAANSPVFNNGSTVGGPVLLDGYGNPLIFVPASGLRRVDRANNIGKNWDEQPDPANSAMYRGPLRARDDKPFWASAGADGKFAGASGGSALKNEGDDNLYSFEQ